MCVCHMFTYLLTYLLTYILFMGFDHSSWRGKSLRVRNPIGENVVAYNTAAANAEFNWQLINHPEKITNAKQLYCM